MARLADEVKALGARIAAADGERADRAVRVAQAETHAREAELALAKATAEAAQRGAERRVAEAAVAAARAQLDRRRAGAGTRYCRARRAGADGPGRGGAYPCAHRQIECRDRLVTSITALDAAEVAREAAAGDLSSAQIGKSEAAAALAALESEARALAPAREAKGALGLVTAARGYEAALAAALADDLAADVGSASKAARRWAGAEIAKGDPALTVGAALLDHVNAPPELARRLSQIAVVDHDDGGALAVGQRIVTRDGKLRRWDGFVSEGTGAPEAERLVRRNRLTEIEAALPAVRASADAANTAVDAARAAIDTSTRALSDARQARDAADAALRMALRGVDTAAANVDRARAAHVQIAERIGALDLDLTTARTGLASAESTPRCPACRRSGRGPFSARCCRAHGPRRGCRGPLAPRRTRCGARCRPGAPVGGDRRAESWKSRSGKAAKRIEDMARRAAALDAEAESLEDAPDDAARAVRRATGTAEDASARAEAVLKGEREAEAILRDREAEAARVGEILSAAREARAGAAARAENQELRRVEMGRVSGERFECPPPVLPEKLGFTPGDVGEAQGESNRSKA